MQLFQICANYRGTRTRVGPGKSYRARFSLMNTMDHSSVLLALLMAAATIASVVAQDPISEYLIRQLLILSDFTTRMHTVQ